MTEQERDTRSEALNHAVRHKTRSELIGDIIKNAKEYLKFLEDK